MCVGIGLASKAPHTTIISTHTHKYNNKCNTCTNTTRSSINPHTNMDKLCTTMYMHKLIYVNIQEHRKHIGVHTHTHTHTYMYVFHKYIHMYTRTYVYREKM